ncbi:energy transducer TonB, partial [Klebsiella pneumoniae]|uniref:energy transducer TonB n=1 Tax=Klebsiella pneumoniae TaxID=573 RepID=UPI002730A129
IEERGTRDFPESRGRKLYGELTMNLHIDQRGRVIETEVVSSSGNPILDRRALAIVQEDRQQNAGYDELSGGPHMRDTIKIRSSTSAAKSERYGTLIT